MSFRIDGQSTLEFEYKQLLGRGRMSEIHIAQCVENPDLKVAIKRHRSDRQNINEWMQQVEREISVLHHMNTAESADWSFDMSLRNRITFANDTKDQRSVIQLLSVFDIDNSTAIAIEIAPPSITDQKLDKYQFVDAMHQIATLTQIAHDGNLALTDIDPLVKMPRIRWDKDVERIKIIDWNTTRETEDYRRRDIIYLGRIFFQLLTGYPAWAKGEPTVDSLPENYNSYAIDTTGTGIESWIQVETAIRDLIERLMIQDANDAITNADGLMSAVDELKQLSDLAKRIENGSTPATNEMENLLQEASNARPPQLRRIANIGDYFLRVAPETHTRDYINQVKSAGNLLKTAYLDRIGQAIEYFNDERYGDAVAELENARSRFTSSQLLTNSSNYRYAVAQIGETLQNNGKLQGAELKTLMDKLVDMVSGLESRLWDTEDAEKIRDDIRATYPPDIVNMSYMQALFDDIEASEIYSAQIKQINESPRTTLIEDGWTVSETQRIATYTQQFIPKLQEVAEKSFIKGRIDVRLQKLQEDLLADQQDLATVERFLNELREGATNINIEALLEKSSLERPYAPIKISKALLPKDQSELSADEVAGDAIERYQTFRSNWDKVMHAPMGVEEKISVLSSLVSENEDMITIFREQLPTVTVPGKNNERKTVYRDLEDLTQFVNSVDFVYDELGSIGINRIPNINKIQQRWVYVTNVQDPELKRFVSSIQANLAAHTNDKVQEKALPPELSMLVYEMLDVPVPTSVMQIGQEIQLHKYIRTTLRRAEQLLKDADSIDAIIGEFNRLTVRSNGELDQAIEQVINKLEQLKTALQSRTTVRQIRTLYQVIKRKVDSDNESMVAFGEAIDNAVDEIIDSKVRQIEKALDNAKANKPLDREEEILVHDTQRIIDTLRHNNRLQERRWHHVQNSQAYLVREYTQTLEQATTAFNDYKYGESRQHIERAFYLAQLFDMPSDKRLPEELRTAEEMVEQLSQHFTMMRAVETVDTEDIKKFLDDEISFWEKLLEIIKDLGNQSEGEQEIELEISFEPQSVQHVIEGLDKAQSVIKAMQRIQRAVDRLRDLEQTIDIYDLELLKPLAQRLEDVLLYRYTQALNDNITELEEIATRERIISNESVIRRVSEGYDLIAMNNTLKILNDAETTRRRRQLQTNSYTALRNMQLKNQDERQALADFIDDVMPAQEVESNEFRSVLTRLAEDANSYVYIIEQVHNHQLPNLGANNNRQLRRILMIVAILAIVALIAGVIIATTTNAIPLPF